MIKRLVGYPFMILVLSACVTINIYFPAAAAEEAARTIVRDVLQSEQGGEAPAEPGGEPQSQTALPPLALVALGTALEALVAPAHAAKADINIDTAAIRAIRASMQRRQSQLAPYYRSGAVGFDNSGSVSIRDLGAVPLAERNTVKKLVADENADRANLYREIARANGHPEWADDVRQTFARVWAEEALSGYWVQGSNGAWRQR